MRDAVPDDSGFDRPTHMAEGGLYVLRYGADYGQSSGDGLAKRRK
jgi:hypothetical protein